MTCTHPSPPGTGHYNRVLSAMLHRLQQHPPALPKLTDLAQDSGVPLAELEQLFADERAVLIALAEDALIRLVDSCTRSVVQIDPQDPMEQFAAIHRAYVDWACANPFQFRLLSNGQLLDLSELPQLKRYFVALQDLTVRMLRRARDEGALDPGENVVQLAQTSRVFSYGLARIVVDDRFREWSGREGFEGGVETILDDFLRRILNGAPAATS